MARLANTDGAPAALPRPVQVLHENRWYDGWLEAQRRDEHGWHGFVRYTVAPGYRYLQWRPAVELRAAT